MKAAADAVEAKAPATVPGYKLVISVNGGRLIGAQCPSGGVVAYVLGQTVVPREGCGALYVYTSEEAARRVLATMEFAELYECEYTPAPAGSDGYVNAAPFHYPSHPIKDGEALASSVTLKKRLA